MCTFAHFNYQNMPNPYFQFKQFTVWHDKCAMKVGTDAVLLGTWSSCNNAKQILDVGCGSGVISLILAQRSDAQILAIDIDSGAVQQTIDNAAKSPFKNHISAKQCKLQDYAEMNENICSFDLIVSNPPYFISSLKCPDKQRNTARHTDTLSVYDLLNGSRRLLSDNGLLSVILPYEQRELLMETAEKTFLHLTRETKVFPTPDSAPKRIMAEFSLNKPDEIISDSLTIEIERHVYTEEYKNLTKDFYLKM